MNKFSLNPALMIAVYLGTTKGLEDFTDSSSIKKCIEERNDGFT